MKFKTVFLWLIIVFFFATSCRTSRQVVQKNETVSETVKETVVSYKDTTLFTPVSKTTLKLPLNLNTIAFKPQHYTQKNNNAIVKVRIEKDTIIVTAKCDSLALIAKIKQELKTETNIRQETSNHQETVKRGVSVFKLILFSLSAFVIGLGMGVLLTKLKFI